MPRKSAGLVIYRLRNESLEVLLVHPGGPFWENKDLGSWSIPKGEFDDDEDPLEAAKRECREEIGVDISGEFISLSPVRLKSGKIVYAWAVENDVNLDNFTSNNFEMEWPLKSGKKEQFPEVDRVEWFTSDEAKKKINQGQVPLLTELENMKI